MSWTTDDMPRQDGRVAVVTGANGGLGEAAVTALAAKGARVVLAARNTEKAQRVAERLRGSGATADVVALDLASLASVRSAAAAIAGLTDHVDLLICNAGLMAPPEGRTEDGFETQLGVNHLGHWVLTAHLLPWIVRTPGARVVTVTSSAAVGGRGLDPANPHMRGSYRPWRAYSESKLANRHFAIGLDARFKEAHVDAIALTAHPGLSRSELQVNTAAAGGGGITGTFFLWLTRRIGMPVEQGVLPILRAATDPQAQGGTMYGPHRTASGHPVLVRGSWERDAVAIRTLWEVSARETGVEPDVRAALAQPEGPL